MARWLVLSLVVVVILANGAATCLRSGDEQAAYRQWEFGTPRKHALAVIARFLAPPIFSPGAADVRDLVLLVALGVGLTGSAVSSCAMRTATMCATTSNLVAAQSATVAHSPGCAWLAFTAAGVTLLALLSTLSNHSLAYSWGWIVHFVAGAAWALLLARAFCPKLVRIVVMGLNVLALCTLGLTIAERATRGLAHFTWPIGAITITAALAATWAACAGAMTISRFRSWRAVASTALCGITFVIAVYVLQQTGRRAPVLGLAAAAVTVSTVLLWLRYHSRLAAAVIGTVCAIAIAGGAIYVSQQARSPLRQQAGSLVLRFGYWQLAARLIADQPVLGHGPGTFTAQMTNAVAPLRAYAPHVYHGNIDYYAHNEWIQAGVELGLPAAVLYFALPVGVMALAIRRLHRAACLKRSRKTIDGSPVEPVDRASTLGLVAGLTAIIVLDSASITLRCTTMPVWYWTFIGLLAGQCRENMGRSSVQASITYRIGQIPLAAAKLALAVSCFAIVAIEIDHASAHARKTVRPRSLEVTRLAADKSFTAQLDNAVRASDSAHARPQREAIQIARSLWSELHAIIPGHQDVPARYADILILAGAKDEARRVLESALSERGNPFNVAANMLYARTMTDDPVVKLRCVQRALRFGPLSDTPQAVLAEVLSQPVAVEVVERELPTARRIAGAGPDDSATGPTVELLRISAFAQQQTAGPAAAVADQRLAAEYYRRLEKEQNPYRRRSEAEIDAFFTLARLLYDASPANYDEAYHAVVAAERYAVLGIEHESVAHPKPEEGFIGGEVVPMEFPESLYPLWRLSALLHIVAGDEHHLGTRVLLGIPTRRWTDADVRRALADLYGQAEKDLTSLAPAQRPGNYEYIRRMALAIRRDLPPQTTPRISQPASPSR